MLHSLYVTTAWLKYLTAFRHECSLPGALRKLVIMRVAILNRAPYEVEQHRSVAIKEGLSEAKIDTLTDWQNVSLFNDTECAMLAFTDAMTNQVQVPSEVFHAVRDSFNDREIVELTAIVAAHNMVSRFLEALQVHAHESTESGSKNNLYKA
jgi:alkylhydroperoxidase family enzyme